MSKEKNETNASVDLFIVETPITVKREKEDVKVLKNILRIPGSAEQKAALRIYSSKEKDNPQVLFASTRGGTILADADGLYIDVADKAKELVGCSYELTEQGGGKKLIQRGKISLKKAAANVVDLGKTGS